MNSPFNKTIFKISWFCGHHPKGNTLVWSFIQTIININENLFKVFLEMFLKGAVGVVLKDPHANSQLPFKALSHTNFYNIKNWLLTTVCLANFYTGGKHMGIIRK